MQFTLKSLPGRNEQVLTLFQGDGRPYICGCANGKFLPPEKLINRMFTITSKENRKAVIVHQWYNRHGKQERVVYQNWQLKP